MGGGILARTEYLEVEEQGWLVGLEEGLKQLAEAHDTLFGGRLGGGGVGCWGGGLGVCGEEEEEEEEGRRASPAHSAKTHLGMGRDGVEMAKVAQVELAEDGIAIFDAVIDEAERRKHGREAAEGQHAIWGIGDDTSA